LIEDRQELSAARRSRSSLKRNRGQCPSTSLSIPRSRYSERTGPISMKVVSACPDFRRSCRGPVEFALAV
jgi:hypothetical protein